ncbi:MAG: hypothetical protein Q8Q89_00540 [bacterium]|nr:hypothetical protein [bacterium]
MKTSIDMDLPLQGEIQDGPATPEQKKLLTSLILERIDDEGEREQWLQETESCFSKSDVSELFSLLMVSRI